MTPTPLIVPSAESVRFPFGASTSPSIVRPSVSASVSPIPPTEAFSEVMATFRLAEPVDTTLRSEAITWGLPADARSIEPVTFSVVAFEPELMRPVPLRLPPVVRVTPPGALAAMMAKPLVSVTSSVAAESVSVAFREVMVVPRSAELTAVTVRTLAAIWPAPESVMPAAALSATLLVLVTLPVPVMLPPSAEMVTPEVPLTEPPMVRSPEATVILVRPEDETPLVLTASVPLSATVRLPPVTVAVSSPTATFTSTSPAALMLSRPFPVELICWAPFSTIPPAVAFSVISVPATRLPAPSMAPAALIDSEVAALTRSIVRASLSVIESEPLVTSASTLETCVFSEESVTAFNVRMVPETTPAPDEPPERLMARSAEPALIAPVTTRLAAWIETMPLARIPAASMVRSSPSTMVSVSLSLRIVAVTEPTAVLTADVPLARSESRLPADTWLATDERLTVPALAFSVMFWPAVSSPAPSRSPPTVMLMSLAALSEPTVRSSASLTVRLPPVTLATRLVAVVTIDADPVDRTSRPLAVIRPEPEMPPAATLIATLEAVLASMPPVSERSPLRTERLISPVAVTPFAPMPSGPVATTWSSDWSKMPSNVVALIRRTESL